MLFRSRVEAAAVGGSVNGVVLDESNFADYLYGGAGKPSNTPGKELLFRDNAYFNYVP